MDQVRVGVDQHLFIHGQAFQLDHAIVDALLCRKCHAGQGLPDIEHPGVHLILAAFQLGEIQHILDEPCQTAGLLADQLQVVVLHLGRDGAVQNAVHKALDGGHGGAQLVGDVAHELTPGVIVGLDVLRHLVEGAGKVCHLAIALHALHADGEVAAAKALGGIGDLLQRVGELTHQQAGQHAGAQQHHAGRQEEVGPELLFKVGELRAGGAQKQPAAEQALVVDGLHRRDIAFFGQGTAQIAESVVVPGVRVSHCVGAPADIQRHGGGGKLVRVGGDEHIALSVGEKQISLGALADDLQLGVQSVQLCALRHGLAVYQILCGALGDIYHLIQCFVAILRKIILEQHPLRAAHQHDAQHHQGGHHGEKGCGDTFTHY